MSFSQAKYIKQYNKENYKTYSFRVKRSDIELIDYLDNEKSRNQVIISLLREESKKKILTIKTIKNVCKPIFKKYGVKKAFLFGSYARNEAKPNSDVDIFIEGLDSSIRLGIGHLYLDLKEVLDKEIDLVESEAKHNQQFLDEIKKDFVRLF